METVKRISLIVLLIGLFCLGFWIGYSYCCLPEKSDGFSKAVHVSFDDVVWVLEDLKQNERRYESAFDNEFLAELKHMHEDYGACFTLYVFEKADGFDIGDMPVKYRKELKENASWLKWGFHWISPDFDKNISLDDFKMSFFNVQNAISKFADSSSLSHVLRLHYFYGNDSIVSFLDSCNIKGLLCADDDRCSYDLTKLENEFMQKNFYVRRDVEYFKTNIRLENSLFLYYDLERLRNKDTLVIFTHEWAYDTRLHRFNYYKLCLNLEWLKKNGYKFTFLE